MGAAALRRVSKRVTGVYPPPLSLSLCEKVGERKIPPVTPEILPTHAMRSRLRGEATQQ